MRFQEFIDEAKKPDFRKIKIGGKAWIKFWKAHPELQDEMLAWKKHPDAQYVKKYQNLRGLKESELSESYFRPMVQILKDMEKVISELKKDKYLSSFVKEVEGAYNEWKKVTTKLA